MNLQSISYFIKYHFMALIRIVPEFGHERDPNTQPHTISFKTSIQTRLTFDNSLRSSGLLVIAFHLLRIPSRIFYLCIHPISFQFRIPSPKRNFLLQSIHCSDRRLNDVEELLISKVPLPSFAHWMSHTLESSIQSKRVKQ